MNPKISVIVPIYNITNYVERCVDSIISQSYKNLEIVLVDDGSEDGSADKIRKYSSDTRVRIINKINGGLSDARNTGLEVVTGEYVLFVDGDDYIEGDCIQILVSLIDDSTDVILFPYLKEYKHSSQKCNLFETNEFVFNETDVKNLIYARLIGPEISITSISPVSMDRLNTAWGKLYKRSLIDGIRFTDTKIIGPEDCWFNIQVFRNVKRVKYTSKTYYRYEKGNIKSIRHKYDERLFEKRWNMYKMISDFIHNEKKYKTNLSNRIVCEEYGLLNNIFMSNLERNNKIHEAKKILCDERYIAQYSNAQISQYSFPWSTIYRMFINKNIIGIELFFKLIKLKEIINESNFYSSLFWQTK